MPIENVEDFKIAAYLISLYLTSQKVLVNSKAHNRKVPGQVVFDVCLFQILTCVVINWLLW
jgi:hypothetical protein